MFRSLATFTLSSALASPDSGDLSDSALLLLFFVASAALVAAIFYFTPTAPTAPARGRQSAPRSRRKLGVHASARAGSAGSRAGSAGSRAGSAGSTEPPPSSSRRRLILLYDVTPGQAPYEYNVGDPAGTRGISPGWHRTHLR